MLPYITIFLSFAAIGFALSALSRFRIGPAYKPSPWTPGTCFDIDGITVRQYADEIPLLSDPVPSDLRGWQRESINAMPTTDGAWRVEMKFIREGESCGIC